mgnify:CR=1 FL=1
MYNKKSHITHSRLHSRRRRRFLGKIFIFLISVAIILFSISFISSLSLFSIHNINIIGVNDDLAESLRSNIDEQLQGKYWHLFARKNFLIFPRTEIEKGIRGKFVQIEDVSISLSDTHTLSVNISERKPYALWCGDKVLAVISDKNKCFYLDKNGLIFGETASSSDDYLVFFGEIDKKENPIGGHLSNQAIIYGLDFFVESLRSLSMKPVSVFFAGNGEIDVVLEKGPKLILSEILPFDTALDNLQYIMRDSTIGWKNNSISSSVSYIDLRFGNKVFFR